jgi:hypothetical protein
MDDLKTRTDPSGRRAWASSALLLGMVALFCAGTNWGRTYPTFAKKTWVAWSLGHSLTARERRMQLYDSTYPVLMYICDTTPPDAVVLLPPAKVVDAGRPGEISLLSSPSSAYNFIYPRVPVNWGDPSPWREKIDRILVYNYWGLDLVQPGAVRGAENRTRIYPWPAGKKAPW